jgi:GH18 family chitinase
MRWVSAWVCGRRIKRRQFTVKFQMQPWLRSKLTQQVITYDDPESLWMKGNLAKHYGLLGVSLFSIDGDNEEGALMASVRDGMGLKS